MGFDIIRPDRAFYIFARSLRISSNSFIFEALTQEKAGAPLSQNGFGPYGEGYVRLSYAASMEVIQKR